MQEPPEAILAHGALGGKGASLKKPITFGPLPDLSPGAQRCLLFLMAMTGRRITFMSSRNMAKKWHMNRGVVLEGIEELVQKRIIWRNRPKNPRMATCYAVPASTWRFLGFELKDGGFIQPPPIGPDFGMDVVRKQVPRLVRKQVPHDVKTLDSTIKANCISGWRDSPARRNALQDQAKRLRDQAQGGLS